MRAMVVLTAILRRPVADYRLCEQVAFSDDLAGMDTGEDMALGQLVRSRGLQGSHSFTAAAADPLLRQRNRPKDAPRRSTSLLPRHLQYVYLTTVLSACMQVSRYSSRCLTPAARFPPCVQCDLPSGA